MRKVGLASLVLLLCVLGSAQAQTPYEELVPEIIATYPHDPSAFTQGLLFFSGELYESTGSAGYPDSGYETTLRRVDIESGTPMQIVFHGDEFFGEGLARMDEYLIQLSWKKGEAIVYDRNDFATLDTWEYEGEGWGLCYDGDGDRFYMSDGSSYISLRDAEDFSLIVRSLPTIGSQLFAPELFNELECVGESLYVNIWQTDYIAVLDKSDMKTTALIDASGLLTEEEKATLGSENVLNGIAYDPERDLFYITGKGWPKLFAVRFVPAPAPAASP